MKDAIKLLQKVKVGSVILEKDSLDTISIGYNRFFLDKMVHAEEVAIENAKKYDLPGQLLVFFFSFWDYWLGNILHCL